MIDRELTAPVPVALGLASALALGLAHSRVTATRANFARAIADIAQTIVTARTLIKPSAFFSRALAGIMPRTSSAASIDCRKAARADQCLAVLLIRLAPHY
jgi:hypothetical protein